MGRYLRAGSIMMELREKEIQSSLGYICAECNQRAYYFKTRNKKLNSDKSCLICSECRSDGILIEDFLFTLKEHIPEHYELADCNTKGTISLKDVLKRFTYDNEQVLEILSSLLCQPENAFFRSSRKYKSTHNETDIEECKKKAMQKWTKFARELKHMRRFTHSKAAEFYDNLISSCFHQVEMPEGEFNSALTILKKGELLYRGRLVRDDIQKEDFLSAPAKALSAPPEYLATNSRMSPSGISFLYTAGDYETAIAELHPFVYDTIAIGQFVTTRELRFFDFTLLEDIKYAELNILDNPKKYEFLRDRYLLDSLHHLISRPFRANDTSYIEMQMFAEAIRNFRNNMYDGIIFGSSQRPGGINYVIFGDITDVDDRNSKNKEYHVEFNSRQGVKFYRITEIRAQVEEVQHSAQRAP